MKTRYILTSAIAAVLATSSAFAQTGRQLQTDGIPVPNADGTSTQAIIDTFWDARCAGNIEVTFNSAFLPNAASGGPLITAEGAAAAIDAGLQRWTDNPSSFVDMSVANISPLPGILDGAPLFDLVNQAQFELPFTLIGFPPGVLAVSISTPLIADATFVVGDDIDGDGDSDVFDPDVEGINVCSDVDGDGDTEYPAGDYLAGTILDNDVLFNNEFVWETVATATGGADIDAVSTHEYGHSHGLTHSAINQISATDGTTATMFPAISIGDPASELATRIPSSDDLSASAFVYPEGSGFEGAAALQNGDIAFENVFSIFQGEVTDGNGVPILGAAVSAINRAGETVAVTFSGDISGEILSPAGGTLDVNIANGNYRLAVPAGDVYTLRVEALDGPVTPGQINTEVGLATAFSTTSFPEESLDVRESNIETRVIFERRVFASPERFNRSGRFNSDLDFVLNEEETFINNAAAPIASGTSIPNILGATQSFQFIEQVDRESLLAALVGGAEIRGLNIGTGTTLASSSPIFSSVDLVTGTIDAETGAITLGGSIDRAFQNVLGQDGDLTPLDYRIPSIISRRLVRTLANPDTQLFIVASIDDIPSVLRPTGGAIPTVRLTITGPDTGASFFSIDGSPVFSTTGVFTVPVNWQMEVRTVTP